VAREGLQGVADALAQADSPAWTARFLGPLGEVLLQLRDWPSLEALAQVALSLHRQPEQPLEVARDWGFLAEVALVEVGNQEIIT
jgi:hypothetical protein